MAAIRKSRRVGIVDKADQCLVGRKPWVPPRGLDPDPLVGLPLEKLWRIVIGAQEIVTDQWLCRPRLAAVGDLGTVGPHRERAGPGCDDDPPDDSHALRDHPRVPAHSAGFRLTPQGHVL